jgi:hypothetical protein
MPLLLSLPPPGKHRAASIASASKLGAAAAELLLEVLLLP